MSVKLALEGIISKRKLGPNEIYFRDMYDGQIGEIIKWSNHISHYNGTIVQRTATHLISLGLQSSYRWVVHEQFNSDDYIIKLLTTEDYLTVDNDDLIRT